MAQPHLKLDLAPHERQLGKYRLLAKLGEGGMGTVYLALASGFGAFRKLLVVKELRRDLAWQNARESSLAMFMDEAQLAARLEHPNVLQTFEAGESEGRYFLAMEYLDGQPLSVVVDRARRAGGLPTAVWVHVLCEVLAGLGYAHALADFDGAPLHVVHRDVSPQNVFITYHGQVKVVDFGVAKANNSASLTSPGMFKGKFAYAAPEQLLGRPVDGRCDLFAVGVMLWEAMSGRRFSESTPSAPAFRTRTCGLEPRIRELVPDADPQLAELCDRALAVEPHDRFPSADAFRLELEAWLTAHGGLVQAAQLGQHMRELFSEDRKLRHEVIEQSMLEAGATHSVMQQLPVEPPTPSARPRTESSTRYRARTPSPTGERLQPPAPSGHRAPPELPPRPPSLTESQTPSALHTPAHRESLTLSAHPGAPRASQPRAPSAAASSESHAPSGKERPQPRPPWVSAALLCALALAVFVTTYQLSSKVASPAEPAAVSGGAAPAAAPLELAAEPAPAERAPRETSLSAAQDAVDRPADSDRRAAKDRPADAPTGSPHARHASAEPRGGEPRSMHAGAEPREQAVHGGEPRSAPAGAEPAPTSATAANPSGEPLAAKPEGKPPAASRTQQTAAPTKTRNTVLRPRNDPALGSDLRELRRSSTIRIDVEDPYQ